MADAKKPYSFLYGPVPSRRLGRSLGIDLVPFKVCTFNCIYCQLGPTTNLTIRRRPYTPAADIIAEVDRWLSEDGDADYLTLSGSGEPTLNSEIAQVIDFAQQQTEIPIALLTNGSLLWDEDVRREVQHLDLLIPSLDAATQEGLEQVNRPAAELNIEQIVAGIAQARQECAGEMWLEVMLVAGVNDTDEELEAIREGIDVIKPHRVQINTVVRPPTEAYATALSPQQLKAAREVLGPLAEIVAPLPEDYAGDSDHQQTAEDVFDLLRRRPCTVNDVAVGLDIHPNEATKYIMALLAQERIGPLPKGDSTYYVPV